MGVFNDLQCIRVNYLLSDADDDLICLITGEVNQLLKLAACVVVLTQRRLRRRHVLWHLFTGVRRLGAFYQLVQLKQPVTTDNRNELVGIAKLADTKPAACYTLTSSG